MTTAKSPQFSFEGTLTFAAVASGATTTADQTVTLPSTAQFPHAGILGDGGVLLMELPNLQTGLVFCNVKAVTATTFTVRFHNPTAGSLTPLGTNAKLVMF